ncbi:MAG: T9SS type A sorting domain-containing protein [Bacteroidales bacterium]|nr:T9SS type A sorting domain-containing protein [Bacteroidales bacterium]
MKKLFILVFSLAAMITAKAQWVDDPVHNNFIANSPSFGGEVILSTDDVTGDTYVQWVSGGSNGYGPSLQRLTFDGTPQWSDDGIRITGHNFSSYSEGMAMCATTDNAVISCFANYDGQTVAVKINADGTYAWGEQGVNLFDGMAFSRTEIIAGNDGGAWALGYDYQRHYLQYIKDNGGLYPIITIAAEGSSVQYGQMTLGVDNSVFLTYEKCGSGFYTEKEIYVVGYTKEGTPIGPDVQLMASQTFQVTYLHHVVPDGLGGGYAYIWHSGIGGAFNTYVFHYDANGFNTIESPDGAAVHSEDPANFYLDAYATVDPVSHDLIIAYIQVNSSTQTGDRIYINRITATGERVWDEGIMVADYEGAPYGHLRIDAFEDGSGFSLVYEKASAENDFNSTVKAVGMDMEGNTLWQKTLSSSVYNRSFCENSAGFHLGQNIVTWVNSDDGGIYGQNFNAEGTMGPLDPVIPVPSCPAPENFIGEYFFDSEAQNFGVKLSWDAPETQPLRYNLYRTDIVTEETVVIGIESEEISYYDAVEIGDYKYQLTAVYEECESDYAFASNGVNYVIIEVTSIPENTDEEIVTVTNIYNAHGQAIAERSLEELNMGLYIIQGLTKDGKTVSRKIVVKR